MLALATKVRVTILESSPSRLPQRSGSKLDKRINDGRGLFAQNNEKGKFELSPDFVHLFKNKWTKSPNTTLPNFHPHTPEQCESQYPRQILVKVFDTGMEGWEKGNYCCPSKKGGSVLNVLARILFDLVLRQILVGVRVSDELPEAIKSELNSIKGLPTTLLKV